MGIRRDRHHRLWTLQQEPEQPALWPQPCPGDSKSTNLERWHLRGAPSVVAKRKPRHGLTCYSLHFANAMDNWRVTIKVWTNDARSAADHIVDSGEFPHQFHTKELRFGE
jgi:hypothetical protein